MITKEAKTDDFTLQLKLNLKNPEQERFYENGMDTIINLIAAAICGGDLYSYFLEQLEDIAKTMISVIHEELNNEPKK